MSPEPSHAASPSSAMVVASNPDLPCAAVGGVMFDLAEKKVFQNGEWKPVEIMADGSWRTGSCTYDGGGR